MSNTDLIPSERIEKAIYLIRGEKVMLDRDLASLYGVETGALNHAVRRNLERFPADFMFQLTTEEVPNFEMSKLASGSEKVAVADVSCPMFYRTGRCDALECVTKRSAR